ncbi:MAG: hypothetical protein IKH93_05770 [Bacteroidales bacterium]|nr:hypothetical protein [Bacteroidales bacterium]MBR0534218.1 hypothetical protein [Bacteroidales bacterium]MBR3030638.1 hypothetical protein [Bacteroidales bacterium]
MENNKEMTARESLALITETMNNNRKDIIFRSGKHFILWGVLLTLFSLAVFILWRATGHAQWNFLWFVMPAVGFPLAHLLDRKKDADLPENVFSRILSSIWLSFCIFSVSVAVFTVLYVSVNPNPIGTIAVGASLTAQIVLLFGMALTISGFVVKNWPVIVAGFVTGIGGLAIYYIVDLGAAQMLIFTFAGVVLALTGVIIKNLRR